MERRLAAIVSTDIVGYSRLMGADEADTLARLAAIDPLRAASPGAKMGGPRFR
jgi:class 3 adenylate cyclase